MFTNRIETASELARSTTGLAASALARPHETWGEAFTAGSRMLGALAGRAEIRPAAGDRRFRDPVWSSHPGYRALMQAYLAWSGGISTWVDRQAASPRDKLRLRVVTDLVTNALSPTNALLTNPAAIRATLDQGGRNLLTGVNRFLSDMTSNGGLPSMVDKTQFAVGENVALTPGQVVHAEDHLELIQYAPQTSEVRARPVFIVPPQINKF